MEDEEDRQRAGPVPPGRDVERVPADAARGGDAEVVVAGPADGGVLDRAGGSAPAPAAGGQGEAENGEGDRGSSHASQTSPVVVPFSGRDQRRGSHECLHIGGPG